MLQDANQSVAGVAGKLARAMFLYPITPSTYASELVSGLPESFYMASELGSIAAVHGASHFYYEPCATFTSSYGLLLMLPSLYKMAGERVPAVVHVAARYVAGAALSIKCDHSDVYLAREFANVLFLSRDAREAETDAVAAYLLASVLRSPVIHAYDGFLTSHEALKFVPVAEKAPELMRMFRREFGLEKAPDARAVGFIADSDRTFELTELQAVHARDIAKRISQVQAFMRRNSMQFEPFQAQKNPRNVQHLVLAAGSAVDTVWATFRNIENVDCVQIKFVKPFLGEQLIALLKTYPKLQTITVLDRVRSLQPGTEHFAQSVRAALFEAQDLSAKVKLFTGVYGLGGREFTAEHCLDVLANAESGYKYYFTVGITDDIAFTSLPYNIASENEKHEQRVALSAANKNCNAVQQAVRTEQHESTVLQSYRCSEMYQLVKKPFGTLQMFAMGQDGCITSAKVLAAALAQFSDPYVAFNSYFDAKKSNGLARAEVRISDAFIPPNGRGCCAVADMRSFRSNFGQIAAKLGNKSPILVNCGFYEVDEVKGKVSDLPGARNLYFIDLDRIVGKAGKTNFHFTYAVACMLEREQLISEKARLAARNALVERVVKFGADATTIESEFNQIDSDLQSYAGSAL